MLFVLGPSLAVHQDLKEIEKRTAMFHGQDGDFGFDQNLRCHAAEQDRRRGAATASADDDQIALLFIGDPKYRFRDVTFVCKVRDYVDIMQLDRADELLKCAFPAGTDEFHPRGDPQQSLDSYTAVNSAGNSADRAAGGLSKNLKSNA